MSIDNYGVVPRVGQPKFETPENKVDYNVLSIWRDAYTAGLTMGRTRKDCIQIANDAVNDFQQQEFK